MSDRVSNRDIVRALYTPEDDGYFMCRLCFVRRKQARGTGMSNLVEHVHRAHADSYEEEVRRILKREGTLDVFMKVDEFALLVYHWIDWCVEENRELSFCEKPKTRKYSNLKPICAKTLKKYMLALEEVVQARIKAQLSGKRIGFSWMPTSNDVERLFSRAGLVFSSLRRAMAPTTLETILFLNYNRVWWDASAVAEAIERTKRKAANARKRQRSEVL
ncbi:hypothetical protein PR002_g25933 [Phytophthora rubi]|uniref:BED-type domain-containing protein n=1 Tax=Phytophthora rubi TaxID=129364 RepID=A0A6A3I2P9_9STRA|nr:hypothetical protein PR002_g25933 [Phytophthora rubi]